MINPIPVFLLLMIMCVPGNCENYPASCRARSWFELVQQADAGRSSQLCKGVVDASLERRSAAEHVLNDVIHRATNLADTTDAREALANMYYREGRYRRALTEVDLELSDKPDAEDAREIRPMFATLARYPDLEVVNNSPSKIHGEILAGNLSVPIMADGMVGNYVVDTGANISLLSESEARRLRLKILQTSSKSTDISGASTDMQLTEVSDLWIGKTHLKHVAFAVYPDSSMPFAGLPLGRRGILGIPVLIALGALRIDGGSVIQIGAPDTSSAFNSFPLVFNGAVPVTRLKLNGKPLNFAVDTGATKTYLYPLVLSVFPVLVHQGTMRYETLDGVSGSTLQKVLVLPSMNLDIRDRFALSPAKVLLNANTGVSRWAAGNLGLDVIWQIVPVTIDFRKMRILFENR